MSIQLFSTPTSIHSYAKDLNDVAILVDKIEKNTSTKDTYRAADGTYQDIHWPWDPSAEEKVKQEIAKEDAAMALLKFLYDHQGELTMEQRDELLKASNKLNLHMRTEQEATFEAQTSAIMDQHKPMTPPLINDAKIQKARARSDDTAKRAYNVGEINLGITYFSQHGKKPPE